MKKYLLYIFLFLCFTQQFHSQGDGVAAFNIPVRNSLKFNRYILNPTFSFVREQNKYITAYNKRQWTQFDNAPETYLFSYSGRLKENIGAGLGVFQQNYGVLTTFGGTLNFAYNAPIGRYNNLTFGTNIGFHQSGLNNAKIITNFPDTSLDNITTNSIFTVNPGLNFGTDFLDFGVALNNLIAYNINTSKLLEENPEQSIQGHIMYTGYMDRRGFFDETKFSTLIRSEFKKDQIVLSGVLLFSVPKGIWAQAGYNTLYGASAGLGLNITKEIAVEYNYEQSIGELVAFGHSHDITLAYRFENKERLDYSGDEDEEALLIKDRPTSRGTGAPIDRAAIAAKKEQERLEAQKQLQAKKEERERLLAETKAKVEAEERLKRLKEQEAEAEKLREQEAARQAEAQRLKDQAAESQEARAAREAEEARQAAAAREAEEARQAAAAREAEEARQAAAAREAEEARQAAEAGNETINLGTPPVAKNEDDKMINDLAKITDNSTIEQEALLAKLQETVDEKQKALNDLKEENDASERGVISASKPVFVSVSAQKAALAKLQSDIEEAIKDKDKKIAQLEVLYKGRLKKVKDKNDPTNVYYQKKIEQLKASQLATIETRDKLFAELESIKFETEEERKRRIKRASYDSSQDKYLKDKAALDRIKQTTQRATTPLTVADLDFGEISSGTKIVRGIRNAENGVYTVIAVHNDVAKRDAFLKKVIAAGLTNVNFFYDVKTSNYFIYSARYNTLQAANNAKDSKTAEAYNNKMSLVKIED